jgi:hypothetical protein
MLLRQLDAGVRYPSGWGLWSRGGEWVKTAVGFSANRAESLSWMRCRGRVDDNTAGTRSTWKSHTTMWRDVCGLTVEKFHESRDDLVGRLFH